jgi:hypothetical protein
MPKRSTVLKALLRERQWQTYAIFCRQYDQAAREIDADLVGHWPSQGQFARWLSADLSGTPQPDHCRVLETMFTGLTVQQLFALTSTADPHPPSPVPAARRPPIDPGPPLQAQSAGVDHDVLDQLAAQVRQLAVDYLTRPPLVIFRLLSRSRADVFHLLDQRQRPAVIPPLYSVVGQLCALLAHASADLGHSYAAQTHTRTAWLCADLADDNSLRAYVRWVQSNVAFWDGDFPQAAQIANSGQRYATKGSNLLRLASQEARAWAACGQAADVEKALAMASSAREQGMPDDQAGVFRFDPGKAAYYASEVRLALGGESNARRAAGNAIEALHLFEQGPVAQRSPEFVAAARLDLANAQLALHDLEGASGQVRTVLQLPVECRTQPIVGRIAATAETLSTTKFTHSGLASELREEIALFRAYSAQRDLPEGND